MGERGNIVSMSNKTVMAALMAVILVVGMAVVFKDGLVPYTPQNLPQRVITIGETPIRVDIADTPELWAQGLSGTEPHPPRALLFIFDRNDTWGIWMKDMKYPIDVLWVSEEGVVVYLEHSIPPSSYPRVYKPQQVVRYVIELPAGYSEQFNLRVGDSVRL